MMPVFNVRRTYRLELDVRIHNSLIDLMRHAQQPHGVFWPLLGTRRSGKTWTLRAIAHTLGSFACFLDLRFDNLSVATNGQERCVLLDEPGAVLTANTGVFLERCTELRQRGITVLVALTPSEWDILSRADTGQRINLEDLHYLHPLTLQESQRMAKRASWSHTLLNALPMVWRRSPFLLELVFETAEKDLTLCDDVPRLLQTTLERCADPEHFYVPAVFHNGLTEAQRDVLRAVAWKSGVPEPHQAALLMQCGLVHKEQEDWQLADPVLADHLPPPLRLHHISDIHVGPKAAESVDVKEKGSLKKALGSGAGAGPVRDRYLDHVRALGAQHTAPHVIIVSGDIVETGTLEQYAAAVTWLTTLPPLLAAHPRLPDGSQRLLIVGGNHDVDWNQVLGTEGARQRHMPFAQHFATWPRPRLEEPPETRQLMCVDYPEFGMVVLLLGSAEFGGEVESDPDQARLVAQLNDLRREVTHASTLDDAIAALDRVARIDPGLVHHADLQRVRRHPWRHPVRIAVLHHPISPMPPTEVARFAGLLNAGQVKDTLLAAGFCLVLHGHMHSGWFAREQWPGQHNNRTLHIAAAPSLGSHEVNEQHGFNEIEVVCEGDQHQLTVRRFGYEGGTWALQATMGPFTPVG